MQHASGTADKRQVPTALTHAQTDYCRVVLCNTCSRSDQADHICGAGVSIEYDVAMPIDSCNKHPQQTKLAP